MPVLMYASYSKEENIYRTIMDALYLLLSRSEFQELGFIHTFVPSDSDDRTNDNLLNLLFYMRLEEIKMN